MFNKRSLYKTLLFFFIISLPLLLSLSLTALNASDPKNDKKLTPRNAAGLVYNIHDADRKKVFADNLKLLSDPRIPPSFRSPLLFPELTEGLIDSLR